mgnify:FL=1
MEVVNQFNNGIQHYRKCEWSEAIDAFKEALARNPDDTLSQTYIDRCKVLKKQNLGDDWNGVWVMKTK